MVLHFFLLVSVLVFRLKLLFSPTLHLQSQEVDLLLFVLPLVVYHLMYYNLAFLTSMMIVMFVKTAHKPMSLTYNKIVAKYRRGTG